VTFFSKLLPTTARFIAIGLIALFTIYILLNLSTALLTIDSTPKSYNHIEAKFSYLIDQSNALTIKEVIKQQDLLKQVKMKDIPYKLSKQSYWVKISLSNKSSLSNNVVLFADNSLLNIFNLYQPNQNSIKQYDLLDVAGIHAKVYPHMKLSLLGQQTKDIFVELQTEGPPNIPLLLLSEDEFKQRMLFTQLVYGIFIGVILLMAMYNSVLYFALKDNVYLIYIGYLIAAFFVLASITGFGYLLFPEVVQNIINNHIITSQYLLTILLLVFALYFLRYDQREIKIFYTGLALCISLFMAIIYSLTIDLTAQAELFFSLQPVIYIYALFIILRRIDSDFSWTKFYLLSWFPLLIGAAIQPLVLLNHLDYSFITRNAFLFGVLFEITLMAFALAERMRRNEQDRLTDISYHIASGLPRKSTLERKVNQLAQNVNTNFSVLMIKPEHIEKINYYIDDSTNTKLFKRLFKSLASLFNYNDAVCTLTDKGEKLSFINNNTLAVIINHDRNKQTLDQLISSIQQIVSENYQIEQLQVPLSANIGIANFPEHGKQSHQLINHALFAMYQSEQLQTKWAVYQSENVDQANYLLSITKELQAAISNNELAIYHQPQIDLKTLRVCSSECLLRWQHAKEGFIPPSVFIPIAEDMGLINQLTLWVIKRALTQQCLLRDEYGYNHMISINISGKDISSKDFFTNVLDLVEASTIPADKIIFELTDSASFYNNTQAIELIEKLTDLGITISVDDFGTGYSTMSQISHFPFQELKVDREFVENVNDDKKRKVIAKATVHMAKGLGLEVVAEGINSQNDEDTLVSFGCDIGQGYFYAKPMPFEDYIQWLESLENGRIKPPLQGDYIPAPK